MMLVDPTAPWQTHIPTDGSGIASPTTPVPTKYGVTYAPPFHSDAYLFETVGPAWSVWEAYRLEKVAAPTTAPFSLQLSFELMVSAAFLKHSHLVETDTIFCSPDGFNSNLSIQRRQDTGQMQLADQQGNWVDSGFIPPPLTPDTWHSHLFRYLIDPVRYTAGTQAMVIDGQLFMVPQRLQGLHAVKQNWTPGALFQAQSCLNETGGASNFMMRNIQYSVVA
jgi:hypothetical protein